MKLLPHSNFALKILATSSFLSFKIWETSMLCLGTPFTTWQDNKCLQETGQGNLKAHFICFTFHRDHSPESPCCSMSRNHCLIYFPSLPVIYRSVSPVLPILPWSAASVMCNKFVSWVIGLPRPSYYYLYYYFCLITYM